VIERTEVLEVVHSERFVDAAPPTIYATLLDEGRYLASISTSISHPAYGRRGSGAPAHRRSSSVRQAELFADRPNTAWSWDITKLLGPYKWTYYYLYVILDIFSRYVVGWMVAAEESAKLAERLISDTSSSRASTATS
jgi:putative transposase